MIRTHSTTRSGGSFSRQEINLVWAKGTIVPGQDPNHIRQDACGAYVQYSLYGAATEGGLGWEVDHIIPVASGGSDSLINLQPLQWQNNRAKGDGPLVCAVRGRQ